MKKYLYTMVAMLMIAATATVFTSCGGGDDDDPIVPEQPKEAKAVSATVKCDVYLVAEMAELVDVVATYTDASGQTKTAVPGAATVNASGHDCKVISISWPARKLPIADKVSCKFTKKAGVEVPEQVKVGYGKQTSWDVNYDNGKSEGFSSSFSLSTMTIKSEKFDEYIDRINERLGEIEINFNEEGK